MKKVLIIVGPQNDFIYGSMPVEGAGEIVKKLALSLAFNMLYDTVIITADMHPDNHCSFIENGGPLPAHCVRHSYGCRISNQLLSVVDIQYSGNRLILDKGLDADYEESSILRNETSRARLIPILKEADEIYVCGIDSDNCVLITVRDLVRFGFKENIIVLKDFIASADHGQAIDNYITKNEIQCS